MAIPELKIAISEMKNSLTGFNSRMEMAEGPVNLKMEQYKLIYLVNREKKY